MSINFCKVSVPVALAALVWVSMALAGPVPASGQTIDLFGTTSLEKRLKKKFKLSTGDMRRLHPLIKRENENVALTFARYADDDPGDFLSLWDAIRRDRRDFETGVSADLTQRQKEALRSARSEFEGRVFDLWVEDYVQLLADLLELNRFQLDGILIIFEHETDKRRKLIINEGERSIETNREWDRLTDERETFLKRILDTEQYRDYLLLAKPAEGLIALRPRSF